MKKTIFIFTLLFIGGSLLSQTPQFNNEISIDQTFTTNSEIFAFNSQSMNGVGIKGSVVLNSDTSLIRVILKDSLTDEYMIFESYPMLDTIWSFNFNEECEETCFMDGFTPTSLLIYIIDANLYLEKVIWNSTPVSNPISLQLSSKQNKVSEKLDKIRAYIDKEYLIWNADYSYFSDLFYFEKVVAGAINLEYPGAEFYEDCNWVKFYGTSWDWSDSGPNGTPDGSTNYLFMAEGHCYQVEHAYIESPPIDLAQHCRIEMNFAYHKNHYANGYDYSSLSVDISNDDGQTWQNDYWKIDGDKDDVWYYKTISLPSDITKLRFHGYFDDATFNLVPHHDMALDDITIGPGSTDDIIITGNETWDNQNYEICQDIIIEPNASLSFAKGTTVSFNEGNKIVVKQEGSLIVDSVFLTSSGDQLWYGIEVWGNPTAPQISSEQGLVILRNGAVIENSEQGIVACLLEENSTKDGWTPNPAYAGGMIQAKNSSLINNCTAIQFYDYPTESGSYLKDCLIEYNYDFDFCSVDLKMVRLRNMQGVEFEGCTFVKSETLVISPTGILAENSDFTVTEYCTNPEMSPCPEAYTQYSVFENLHYGIRSYNSSPNPVVEVDYAIFANNTQGIYIGGTTNSSVTNSEFTTRNNYFGGYGLYLDQSEGYTIEENVFEQGTSNYNSVGLIINHRGPLGDNVIYLNQFYEHLYAALAQGENRTYDEAGLQFRCNIFDPSCINNIIVVYPGQFNTPYAGISAYQGADIPQPDGPAGNLFSNSTQGGTSTDTDIYNESNSVTYYYHINEDYPLRPIYVTLGKVFPNEVFDAEWNEESCPPSEQGGGGQGDRGMLLSMISNASTQADSVETIIQLLEDDGSTENMKTEVELSTPPETYQVYNDLMSGSPYISDTVMEAAIEKEEVLPNVMIRDVMVANPHNAKNELLMEKIDERSNPMPAYMKAQILQGGSLVLFYEELQSKRSYYNRKRSEAFKGLVKSYLKDTVNQAASIDSLMELLENENSINAKYRLAFLGVEQGDWSMGQGVINGIPQQFNLEGDELERYEQMLSFYNLLSALSQQGKTIAEADSSQVETLFEIEAAQIGLPSVYARNVLLALEEITYQEPIFLPDFTKSAAMQLEYEILKQALDEHHYMAVFPNPAGDYLIIEHKLEMEAASVYAEIRNIKGEFVMDMALSGIQNQQTVDIKTLKAGIYIITLYVNNKELESVKFTKTN